MNELKKVKTKQIYQMMNNLEEKLIHALDQDSSLPIEGSFDGSSAAVLILLVRNNGKWHILYTRRTNNVKTHQGEVSFPGGGFEEQDQSLRETALRETWEEIGINPSEIKIYGSLPPTKTISNFMVYPFVGVIEELPALKVNKNEVEKVFLIPLDWLMDQRNYYEKDVEIGTRTAKGVLHYEVFDNELLWGLTARITQQLIQLIK